MCKAPLPQPQGFSAWTLIRRAGLALVFWPALVWAAQPGALGEGDLNVLVRAGLRTDKLVVQAGKPVWVEFTLTNLTENRLTLRIPDVSSDPVDVSEMGLPVEHIFSGQGFGGPALEDERGEVRDSKVAIRPKGQVPAIKLAPFGSVGIRLDVTRYYPSMLRPGRYKMTWRPYNGSVVSDPLFITVLAERQAVILTDFGKMTVRFYYDQAPNHVQNFIDLVEQRFYDNLPFNRLIPGGLIQGGDSLGNRRGIRPDGKRLKAEFSSIPFEFGTMGMARSMQDPDSASSQFFICLGRQPGFDGQQTAFGYLVGNESFETLRRLAAVPTGTQNGLADYPKQPIYIRAISLESVPPRDRQSEPKPITPPASQPHPTILGDGKALGGTASAVIATPAATLPGLRAQGRVGRRPATAPE
jgi:peptidyl-prolyl cis-trans isomerase B (cyclophilin B)